MQSRLETKTEPSEAERPEIKCPVCGSTQWRAYVTFPELAFSECCRCRTVFKTQESKELLSPTFYEEGYYRHKRSRRLKRFEHRKRKARNLLLNAFVFVCPKRLLDVGCAVGEVIAAGQSLGLEALGCDISRFAVDSCNENGLPAKIGTMEDLPVENASVDIVVMKHVLEHTPEPHKVMLELRRVLAPGGAVIIAVPDLDYWKPRWRRKSSRYFHPTGLGRQHYVYYSVATLTKLLSDSGFVVRAASKAVFRRSATNQKSTAGLALEAIRFSFVAVWQWMARTLRLRREITVIATVSPQTRPLASGR